MRLFRTCTSRAGRLSALAIALPVALGLLAPQAQARTAAEPRPAPPATTAPASPHAIPVPKSPDVPLDGRPLASQADAARAKAPQAGGQADHKVSKQLRSAPSATAAAPCRISDFTSRTGAALVQQVKAADLDCINSLFPLTGSDAQGTFREAQMVSVADALRVDSASYPGDNSASTGQLVLFLRAGYYVQWIDPAAVGSYGTALQTSIRGALDAFFAAPRSRDVSQANGDTLAEAVTLIDSAQENARYTGVVKRLLTDYDGATWTGTMWGAVYNTKTVVERGLDLPAFVGALQADPGFAASLASFVTRNSAMIKGNDLATSLGIQVGNLLSYPELKTQARPLVKDLINRYPLVGDTGPLTMNLAWFTEKRDGGNCAYYGTCDLPTRLIPLVLTVQHTCNANLRIRAEQMTAAELASTCTSLVNEDSHFHKIIRDSGPLPGDLNTSLEVVVFDSYYDYSLYAWSIYGIEVDNGGMYEEGNPANPANQARFIAHEATWLPSFEIWNLNHEYTHYLDGRYDMFGDFDAGLTTPTIWWVEGIAEYISYSYRGERNANAITQAAAKTYKLSELFDTTYDMTADATVNSTRVYAWGYLAVRYMLQSHPQDVQAVLAKYRTGDWAGARTLLKSTIGTRYDAGFATWLTACAADDCGTLPPPQAPLCTAADTRQFDNNCRRDNLAATTGNYSYHFLYLPAGVKQLTITTEGGTGNADLYYNGTNWATTGSYLSKSTGSGNGETLTVANPPAGWVFFSLAAQQGFSGVTATTAYTTAS
ncbi:M9 family metallopeptidase [Kitasatospora sp. NPDC057015]|uniref:M9 family metallopeptidase n=1 Tax=Kitasatospora sp. NPDC057015 TaxID=3346001 RepID=UPI0036278B6F